MKLHMDYYTRMLYELYCVDDDRCVVFDHRSITNKPYKVFYIRVPLYSDDYSILNYE